MAKKTGLGKGLNALFLDTLEDNEEEIVKEEVAKEELKTEEKEVKKSVESEEKIPTFDIETSTPEPENYVLPPIDLLQKHKGASADNYKKELIATAEKLQSTLDSFGVSAKVINVSRGPAVTRYELAPDPGVKVSKIVNLTDDIALNLAAPSIRMEAPIPGKSAVGIEIPNTSIDAVFFRDVVESDEFRASFSFQTRISYLGSFPFHEP